MDILLEFLEVSVHSILYNRHIYPQGVFEKRTKYNVPVQMCLHPDVNAYISELMASLKLLMSKGPVDKVSVVILDEASLKPLERFVFEIANFRESWKTKDPHLFDTEQALRGFLLKLNVSDALLEQTTQEQERTWTLHAHTNDSTLAASHEELIQKDFPWAEADEREKTLVNAKMVPLRSASTQVFDIQLYVEEGEVR